MQTPEYLDYCRKRHVELLVIKLRTGVLPAEQECELEHVRRVAGRGLVKDAVQQAVRQRILESFGVPPSMAVSNEAMARATIQAFNS